MGDESRKIYADLFSAILTKPIRQQQLAQVVQLALKSHRTTLPEVAARPESTYSLDFARQYPLRILIAEDNLVNIKLLERVLTKLGYTPVVAHNGQEVLNCLADGFDLILMDVQMPEMDGLEADPPDSPATHSSAVDYRPDGECDAGRPGTLFGSGYE